MEEDIETIKAYLSLISFKSPFAKIWTNLLTRLNVILSSKIYKVSPKVAKAMLTSAEQITSFLSNVALNLTDRAFLAALSIEISHLREKIGGAK